MTTTTDQPTPSYRFVEVGEDHDYWNPGTREISLAALEQPEGDTIIGIQYRTDYKAEEEYGVADLRKALTSDNLFQFALTDEGKANVAVFTDVNGFILSTRPLDKTEYLWGEAPLDRFGYPTVRGGYAEDWERDLLWKKDRNIWEWERKKAPELREYAKTLGISPLPRSKKDLIAAILDHPQHKVEIKTWPAWFQYGDVLIVRADSGPVAEAVAHVREAVIKGTLAVGNASGPFSTGVFFYDSEDETEALRAERNAEIQWHMDRMAEAEPTKQAMKDAGWRVYALGSPRAGFQSRVTRDGDPDFYTAECDPKAVYYWLNAVSPVRGDKQKSGWFTLDELTLLMDLAKA